MLDSLTIIPEEAETQSHFKTPEEYERFREEFVDRIVPIQEQWREARRRSEEEARHRLLR